MTDADRILDAADIDLLGQLWAIWSKHRKRNLTRSIYYDGKAALKDFGISLPPAMKGIGSTLGWTAKGIHALTDRSQFEGFTTTAGDGDLLGADEIALANGLEFEFPAAQVSSAIHGCAFLAVSNGDVQSGEPAQVIAPVPADRAAAIWDPTRRRLRAALNIIEITDGGQPLQAVMYTPRHAVLLKRIGGAWGAHWEAEVIPNPLGRVSVAPLPYQYETTRPLGHSRITRASMGFVDSAIRTIVRAEVSSEFYSAPEYWLFGADVSQFAGSDRWDAVMGRIKALRYDPDEGEPEPTLHRFNGASPQPHTEQLRMWANEFAHDQDLALTYTDGANPSSAQAIFAAKEPLITATEKANRMWRRGLEEAVTMAMMLRDGLTVPSVEMRSIRAQFADPRFVSPSERSDAFVKRASAIGGYAESTVGMRFAGMTPDEIKQFQAEQRRNQALNLAAGIAAAAGQGSTDAPVGR